MTKNLCAMLCLFFGLFPFGGQSKPDWVKKEPRDPHYYSTTVKMPKKNNPGYKDAAYQTAMHSISMQISVQILAGMQLHEFEENGIVWSEYESRITTESKAFIKNVEMVDTYETKKHYWAYYRLNKREYLAERERMKAQAVSRAGELIALYETEPKESAAGLVHLLKALEAVEDFLDMELSLNGENIYNKIMVALQHLSANLTISLDNSQLSRIAHYKEMDTIRAKVSLLKDGQNIAQQHFPLMVRFSKGEGQITRKGMTDERGMMDIELGTILSFEPRQQVEITLERDHFLHQIESDYVRRVFGALSFRPGVINLNVEKPAIYIDYSLDGKTKDARGTAIYSRLPLWNLDISSKEESAQYILRLNATSRMGDFQKQLGQHLAYVALALELTEQESGKILSSRSFAEVKGGSAKEELAIPQAEKAALEELAGIPLRNIIWQCIFNPPLN